MTETQLGFIKSAAKAIEKVIEQQTEGCELVKDVWHDKEYCRTCEIGALAQMIRIQANDYGLDHPEIYR